MTPALVIPADPRRFAVRSDDGAEIVVDMTAWSHPALTAQIAPLLKEYIARMGPTPIARSVRRKVLLLQRFWAFLADRNLAPRGLGDITVDLINGYEGWLEQNAAGRLQQRHIIAGLISLLRIAAETPDLLALETVKRLTFLGHGHAGNSRPRDAYSSGIAEALRAASKAQIAEARRRIALDGNMPSPPSGIAVSARLRAHLEAVHAEIVRCGAIETGSVIFARFYNLAKHWGVDGRIEGAHAEFYLTPLDLAAFLVLLTLETGLEMECLLGLKADCLRNPTSGYVEIEYFKRRARGAEWKRLRVRDGSSGTPGGLIRLAIQLTERARRWTASDGLWVLWTVDGLRDAYRESPQGMDAFIKRYQITDDDGDPLRPRLSRLRKTHKSEWYRRTGGQLEQFAVGHSIQVAARHYADIPALRHVHEQAIADAFRDALDIALKPRIEIVTTDLDLECDEADDDRAEVTSLAGEQDVWLARCEDFYASPFGETGQQCPKPFWGCLECENAVITAQKLPALLAFEAFVIEQRKAMNPGDWSTKFGRAWYRITEQILPAFAPAVVEAAREAIAKVGSAMLYLPVEVMAQ
jgi:hypothetical protein